MQIKFPFWNRAKGADTAPLLSDDNGLLMQPVGGKWMQASKHGKLYTGNMAATGIVLPLFSATAQVFGLWNPSDSGVNGWLVGVRATYVDTTGASGGYCLAVNKKIGASLATGGISAFTEGTPECGLIGSKLGGNRIRFTPSAATTIAPTVARQLGINQLVITATDATNMFSAFKEDFDGEFGIPPGTAVWLAGNIATLAKLACSISWVEEPV